MGRYKGQLKVTWVQDGRHMDLLEDFSFIDGAELAWDVPGGARINGASIPQWLWTITGSPYVGNYRDASVVHDWYCCVRTRTSDATHAMFHEAMIVSGVSPVRARIMYAAVRYAGPSWSDMDVYNANLATRNRWRARAANRWGPGGLPPFDTPAYYEELAKDASRTRAKVPPRVPSGVTAEQFFGIADDILAGRMDLVAINQINADLNEANSAPLAGGVFPFAGDDPFAE